MKKLLVAATVAGSLISSMAFAKTEGNYVGVDLLATKFREAFDKKESGLDVGLGVNYKYAINFNNFFIAPGVYFDYNNADVSNNANKAELDYSYGTKVDLGYDITDKIATFVSIGYKEARITSSENNIDVASQTEGLITYGVGAKYALNDNLDLGLSYEYGDYIDDNIKSSLNIDVVRLGVAYKF